MTSVKCVTSSEHYANNIYCHKEWVSECCFTSLSAHLGNIATEGSPNYALFLFRKTWMVLYSEHHHRQHCTQFGALYNTAQPLQNHDDKYLARQGFEPCTSRLQAPVDTNEPFLMGPALSQLRGLNTNFPHFSSIFSVVFVPWYHSILSNHWCLASSHWRCSYQLPR